MEAVTTFLEVLVFFLEEYWNVGLLGRFGYWVLVSFLLATVSLDLLIASVMRDPESAKELVPILTLSSDDTVRILRKHGIAPAMDTVDLMANANANANANAFDLCLSAPARESSRHAWNAHMKSDSKSTYKSHF
jgi:hypothetical protein